MLTRALEMADMKLLELQVTPLEIGEQERAFKEGRITDLEENQTLSGGAPPGPLPPFNALKRK